MNIDDNKLYGDKEMKGFEKLYEKLINLEEQTNEINIENLKQNKTVLLIAATKNYLEIYKTEFPETLKKKFKFSIKSLEEKLDNTEKSIEILRKQSQ